MSYLERISVQEMDQNFTISHNPVYLKVFEFEKYDHEGWRLWLKQNWTFILYMSLVYVSVIHYGQKWMADRKPYNVKRNLVIWNTLLTLLSLAVFVRMVPELYVEVSTKGLYSSFCHL